MGPERERRVGVKLERAVPIRRPMQAPSVLRWMMLSSKRFLLSFTHSTLGSLSFGYLSCNQPKLVVGLGDSGEALP